MSLFCLESNKIERFYISFFLFDCHDFIHFVGILCVDTLKTHRVLHNITL